MISNKLYFEATHLSNQAYDICWRQDAGYCGICWLASIQGNAIVSIIIIDTNKI